MAEAWRSRATALLAGKDSLAAERDSLTAENTQRLDPVIADLHRDYAQQSSTGRHMVVEGFHHNDIVFSAGASATLVREIASMTGAQEVRS